jgi:hypothetical protein
MNTQTYECEDYNIRLYETNKDIILLDIFINNKNKYKVSMSYYDNIINYYTYKTISNYVEDDNAHWRYKWIKEEHEERIDQIKINLNELFQFLHEYYIYSADYKRNIISTTLIKKDLLKEFTMQIDENIILDKLKYIL